MSAAGDMRCGVCRAIITQKEVRAYRASGKIGAPPVCGKHGDYMRPNGFERTGRAKKVAAMLRIVDSVIALMPAGTTDEEAAVRFSRFRHEDRARVTLLAGVNRKPSDDTWAAFIEAVRERKALAALDETGGIR